MTPLAYTGTGAKYIFDVVMGMFAASEWSIRFRSRRSHGGTHHDRGSLYAVIATSLIGVGAAFALAGVSSWDFGGARWPIFIVGMAITVLGVALRQWSVATLGQFFTIQVQVRSGQTVVDTGPYRFVRHPSYTAIITSFVGIGIALENWLSLLALLVVPTIGLVIRIRVEERALLAALGEPYQEFSATRARLVPKVW